MHYCDKSSQSIGVSDDGGNLQILYRARLLIVGALAVCADEDRERQAEKAKRYGDGGYKLFGRHVELVEFVDELWVGFHGNDVIGYIAFWGDGREVNIETPHNNDYLVSWYSDPGVWRRVIDEEKGVAAS